MAANFDELRQRLEEEREHLTKELRQITLQAPTSRVSSESSPFGKREEEATVTFELEKRLALEKNLRDQLGEVEHALDKFKAGTYGLCDNCGQPIEPERLQVLPRANLCLRCKRDAKNRFPPR
jgi:DnaK suppressor protein